MRLNKDVQYALLFCFYLSRSGRANIHTAAVNLGLSKQFLDQVARKLRISGIINSVKGPGGGFELNEQVTFYSILAAFKAHKTLSLDESRKYMTGTTETRAMQNLLNELDRLVAGSAILNSTPKEWGNNFVLKEVSLLNTLGLESIQN